MRVIARYMTRVVWTSSKRDKRHQPMRCKRSTAGLTIPDDDVDHAIGNTGFGNQLGELQHLGKGEFGGFKQDSIASGRCRTNLPVGRSNCEFYSTRATTAPSGSRSVKKTDWVYRLELFHHGFYQQNR